ncbi:MAG: hypothetical protein JWO15_1533 [Sphingomonadales bacterium]|nr:hypothetical protein [Sphingomonadales bacterium]
MWIRSGFWLGTPRDEAAFHAAIVDEIVPMLKRLPGVDDAQALWPRREEPGAPQIACQMLVHVGGPEAIELMLASPGRAAMRTRVVEILADFDGIITHIDYEVV